MAQDIDNSLARRLLLALALGAVLSALWWAGWTLLLWWRWHPQLPWRDLFVILDNLRPLLGEDGSVAGWLAFLAEPHFASHRIALPRLLVALDLEFFGARNQLLYLTGWAGLLLLWWVPLRLAIADFGRGSAYWWFYAGVVGLLLFAPAHLWNLVNGINTAWHLSLALAVSALAILSSSRETPSLRRWLLAYLLATLAAFSTFAGVILWLLLPLFALGGDRRALVITLLASTGLTVCYLQGIASDASVAVSWQAQDPDVVRRAREVGEAALAANTPWRILLKTINVLGWPLAAGWPVLASTVVAISLLVPVLAWLWAGYRYSAGEELPSPWVRYCLMLSALTVGTALAIQLGRVIEQPNYAHGPSYERYSTIVALYWCSVMGLLLTGLQQRSAAFRVGALSALLAVGWLLLVPGGSYLREEVDSLESAARLYAEGENTDLRARKGRAPSRLKPAYVYSFDDLFQPREATYKRPVRLSVASSDVDRCGNHGIAARARPTKRPGWMQIEARIAGPVHYLARDILLSARGQLLARLVPEHQGKVSAMGLLSRDGTLWRGRVPRAAIPDKPLHLTVNLLGGFGLQCELHVAGPGAKATKVE